MTKRASPTPSTPPPASSKRKGRALVYLVHGEEDYVREQAIEDIRARVMTRDDGAPPDAVRPDDAFACDVLYGDDTTGEEILTYAREVPFLSSTRLILLKWADKLPTKEGDALMSYFAAPNDSTTLIISARKKLDKRLKWVKECRKHAEEVDCEPWGEKDWRRAGWLRQETGRLAPKEAARWGLRFDVAAMELLKDVSVDGLHRVCREVEKLALYVSPGDVITARDVIMVQGMDPGASVFDMAGAMAEGNEAKALSILEKNLETGEAPLRILGALLAQYRRLWKAKDGLSRHVAGVVWANDQALVARIPLSHFPEIFAAFASTDRALKGAAVHAPRRIMHDLIFGMCQRAKRAASATSRAPMRSSRITSR